jgi:predicted DCC family thiol-disulfide oxidoreductase YuxK
VNQSSQHLILFDGVCNLCNATVQFVIKRDPSSTFKFGSLQSGIGQGIMKKYDLPTAELNSLVYIHNEQVFQHSSAALQIAKRLIWPWKSLYLFMVVPKFIRDGVYRFIARNRYSIFGKTESCMVPTAELKKRFLG